MLNSQYSIFIRKERPHVCLRSYRVRIEHWELVHWSDPGPHLDSGFCQLIFAQALSTNKQQYAVSSDGQRFLVNLAADEGATSPITLIYNWKPQPAK